MITSLITGFATSFSLILAIGAQNALVLRQGLLREHVFWLCLLCAMSDALLITIGVAGFGAIVELWPLFPKIMLIGGVLFLIAYGAMRFLAAWRGDYEIQAAASRSSLRGVLLTGLAFTWLNPHVYLDTLGLVGAISTGFEGADKWAFGIGGISASFVFFFGLGYSARVLSPIMQSPLAWRRLDVLIGIVMWALAAKLAFG